VAAIIAALLLVPGAGGVANAYLTITPLIYATLGANGWYTSNVTVNWRIDADPPLLESVGCNATTLTVDTLGTQLECRARNDPIAPNDWVRVTKTFRIDKTPPAASGAPDRGADANTWYNHPVGVSFSGADAISGLASCSVATYSGPDNAAAVVGGTCRDNAGNVATATASLKYDATPPSVTAIRTKPWNRSADISWQASSDTRWVEVSRAPGVNGAGSSVVHQGTDSSFRDTGLTAARKYSYTVTVVDEAANRAGQTVEHIGTHALLTPAPAQQVSASAPPRLTWAPVKGAKYYNVQVVRGRRVLSAWPATTSLQLRRTWTMDGRRYRFRPGLYRWYVWPGFGRLTASRYGPRLGGSTFVVSP
jgi:hypothetical protein